MKMTCKCKSEAQDKLHGKGVRVFNQKGKADRATCSVCGAEKRFDPKAK